MKKRLPVLSIITAAAAMLVVVVRSKSKSALFKLNLEWKRRLALSEQRYQHLFENMIHGFAYCKATIVEGQVIDYSYVTVNAAYETLTGSKGLKGKSAAEVMPGLRESDPHYFEMAARVVLSGETESMEMYVPGLEKWFLISMYRPKAGFFVALVDNITEQKKSEEKLRHSELRLKEAQAIGHIGNWELDLVNNKESWSDEVYEIYGTNKAESKPSVDTFMSFMHPDDLGASTRRMQLAFSARRKGSLAYRFVRKDGEERHGYAEWKFEHDEMGNPVRLFGITQDITEKKVAEEAKEFDRSNLYSLINNTKDIMWSVDREYRLITSNQAFDEIVASMCGNVVPTGNNILDAGFSEERVATFRRFYDRAFTGESFTEVEHARLPEELWSEISFHPILREGKVIGTACFSRDVTERKWNEKTIKEERILLRTLIDNLPVIVYTKDVHSKRTLSNRADYRYLGALSEEEVLGKDDSAFFSSGLAHATRCEEQHLLETGEPVINQEEHRKNSGGDTTWFLKSKIPLINQDHEIIGLIGLGYDITERKKAEMEILKLNAELEEKVLQRTVELEVVNSELEEFTYSVSHDLRAPLRIIDGFGQILAEEYGTALEGKGQQTLKVIMDNARRMGQLIDDLLAFSRSGKVELRTTLVDMNELVGEAIHELRISGVAIPKDFRITALAPVQADANLMKQVWINLIDNAIKYSGKVKVPRIEIGMNTGKNKKVYYVKDNGAGFDMKYYPQLFGVFRRLHSPEEFEGTGVGLALIQRILSRHGGTVWAEAEPEQGATFFFSLPEAEMATKK